MPQLNIIRRRGADDARSHCPGRREDGVIMIIWVMSLTALLGFVAVALAAGDYVQSNGNAQNAADAAALAAATVVGQSTGSLTVAEQTAADSAESLAQNYSQVPNDGAHWNGTYCQKPSGFTLGDPAQTNCVGFAQASSLQTLVTKTTPTVGLSAPNVEGPSVPINPGTVVAAVKGTVGSGSGDSVSFFLYTAAGPASPPQSCVTDSGILPVGWSLVASEPAQSGTTYYPLPGTVSLSLPVGYYWWEAYYDGAGTNNLSASSGCSSEETWVPGQPVLALSAPDVVTADDQVGATGDVVAQPSGLTGIGGGSVSFYEAGPLPNAPGCITHGGTGWTALGGAVPIGAAATYEPPVAFSPSQPGDYWWDAVLTGGAGGPADSSCGDPVETVVNLTVPRVTLSAPELAGAGEKLPLSGSGGADVAAQLSGTAGSTNGDLITFYESGPSVSAPACYTSANGQGAWTAVGTATVNGDGTYAPNATFGPVPVGTYWWDAVFSVSAADTVNGSADSSCTVPVKTVVGPAPTSPSLSLSVPNTERAGQVVDPNAVVADISGLAGTNPSGTITFYAASPSSNDGTCPGPQGNGSWLPLGTVTVGADQTYTLQQAHGSLAALGDPGELSWYASYSGDANNSAAGTGCGIVAWVEVPGQSLPTILGTGVNQGGSVSYAVYSQASGKGEAKLCYYPGNCATA